MRRVLVVDDETGILDMVKTFLEYHGMKVTTAGDGVAALKCIEKEEFDVVLSDIMMPKMDGLALAGELRRLQPDAAAILMTGYASVNSAVEAIKHDVFDYILKPFQNMEIVLHAIRRGAERKDLIRERKTLVEDLRRTNDELVYHRQLLTEKVGETNDELTRRIDRLSALFDISRTASSITNLKTRLDTISQKISGVMGESVVSLWLKDRKGKKLAKYSVAGIEDGVLPDHIGIREDEIGAALKNRHTLMFRHPDEVRAPALSSVLSREKSGTVIVVPLLFEEETLGLFVVVCPKTFAVMDDDISMVSSIAEQTAVSIRNSELYESQRRLFSGTVEALASAIDSRDHYTGGHSLSVTQYALAIARKMGFDIDRLELIRIAGLLHDIGKIAIGDSILNKPGKLNEEEMGVIKSHPVIGKMIIETVEALKPAARIIYHHHEHFDGSGYPDGILGPDTPVESRILQVADIFHALTSDRIYRKAMPLAKALSIIREETGTVVDPDIGRVFLELIEKEHIHLKVFQLYSSL